MSCAVDIYDSAPHFQWITRGNGGGVSTTPVSVGKAQLLDSMRFTIQDLVQQESCIGSSNYPVDKPSRLVQIECRKPGCRCVLKNERALAMKIVPGVTLVQGEWLLPNNVAGKSNWSQTSHQHMTNPLSANKSGSSCSQNDVNGSQFGSACSQSVVLTSCCPSWFELVRRSVIGPTDTGSQICPEVPVWSSCKAVWRAKPKFILLRKETQCLFATNAQSLIMSSSDLLKKDDRTTLTLDADNVGLLRPGTVLQLIDCRLCRLIHKDDQTTSSSSYRFSSRYRSKPVSMLQCSVVGGKALAALAASITNLSPQDALNWFSTGPRLVYLSLASKSIMCSPVNISSCSSVNTNTANNSSSKHSSHIDQSITDNHSNYSNNGVHSILSLLSTYQLPIITRPVVGLRSSEWFFMGRLTNQGMISNSDSVNMHSLLQIFSCHHGDLIFLEPLSDCTGSIYQNESNMSGKSRFFVVTTDMLMQHYFLVADSPTCQLYSRELETHAFRVSHFLAACHPVQGLTYILKHLEDISHSSNTGPSYTPLTRTLGPITNRFGTIAIQSAVTSIAAIASLAMHEEHNDIPNDPYHQLNEIQPKILNYLSLNSTIPIGAFSSSSSPPIDNIDFYHSTNCLNHNNNTHLFNTHSSLSSSIFASETDEMNALCDEIEDIYFYVRNGHFPMHSHSLSSLHQRHEEKSMNASAPISPYLNKLQSINQYSSNKKINNSYNPVLIEHEIRNNNSNSNNNINNCPVKITSKAPVLLIRPKPYENCSTSGDEIKQFTSTSSIQPPAQSWNQQNVNYSTGNDNSYYPYYQQSKELNFTPKPWQPITNDHQSSRCHVKSRPILNNNNNNKSNIFPNTSTTSATSTSAKINNYSGNSMAFISLTPSSVHQCNHSVSVTSSTSLTSSSYEYGATRPPPPTTTTTTTSRTGQHFIQTIPPKLYINNNNNNNNFKAHENGVASVHKSNHLIQQSMYPSSLSSNNNKQPSSPVFFYSSNHPAVTLSTCSGNQLTRPLFMTATSTSMLDRQNCTRYTNENPNYSEECIYDEPKEVEYSTQQYKTATVVTHADYSRGNRMPAFTTTNDISCYPPIPRQSISSPSQNRRHLSLSTSHLYPSVSVNSTRNRPVYESDMPSLDGNIFCPTTSSHHLIIGGGLTTPNTTNITAMTKGINHRSTTAFHSTNNLSNDEMTTSMINRIQIIPRMGDSSNYTTALPNNNNNSSHETHYFPTNTNSSNCMTTSSNNQLHQEQPTPPSMPLLYNNNIPSVRTPRTPSRTSRLYQSTILPSSTNADQKQQVSFVHRPYPFIRSSNKQINSTTHINSGCYDPSVVSNTALLQSPRHKSTELTNSSPDTGIGVESNYDQQITSGGGGGGCFMPLNAYQHSSSSSTNMMMRPKIVWSPIESNSLQQRQDSETSVKTGISSSNYENQPGKQWTSCKLTKLFVNNTYLNNTIGTTNTTTTTTTTTAITNHHNNRSVRKQPLYRF